MLMRPKHVFALFALGLLAAGGAAFGLRSAVHGESDENVILGVGAVVGNDANDDDDDMDDQNGADEGGDVQVGLEQCPAAVQDTIRLQVGTGSINEIERSPAGNYEVDAQGRNGSFEFVVAGNGAYLGPGDGDDEDEDDDGGDDGDDD